jgi:hypothetical protein
MAGDMGDLGECCAELRFDVRTTGGGAPSSGSKNSTEAWYVSPSTAAAWPRCRDGVVLTGREWPARAANVVRNAFGDAGVDWLALIGRSVWSSKCSLAGSDTAESEDISDEMTSGEPGSRLGRPLDVRRLCLALWPDDCAGNV